MEEILVSKQHIYVNFSLLQPSAYRWQHTGVSQIIFGALDILYKDKNYSIFPSPQSHHVLNGIMCHFDITLLCAGHTAHCVQATNTDVPEGDLQIVEYNNLHLN